MSNKYQQVQINWENGKTPESIAYMGKQPPSVLLNLFISGNDRCHNTEAPSAWAELKIQYYFEFSY